MGTLLLSVIFSYFTINKLDFFKPRGSWPAVAIFVALLAGVSYGLAYFVRETVVALPKIAETAVPVIVKWAGDHQIKLPFADLESLKEKAVTIAAAESKDIGKFANFASGATKEFIYLIVGCVVAMGLFLNPRLEMDRPPVASRNNLYSLCCEEIGLRFATFYQSFSTVMEAQVTIAAIDTTLTGIFVAALGLPYLVVAVGVTFLCGLLPVVGNLLSNTVVVGLGFSVSPAKGVGALVFLVCIHNLEYFLNSKIVGGKIRSPIWLTLLALAVGEGLMGVTGMILAPVVLHYIRIETAKITVHDNKVK